MDPTASEDICIICLIVPIYFSTSISNITTGHQYTVEFQFYDCYRRLHICLFHHAVLPLFNDKLFTILDIDASGQIVARHLNALQAVDLAITLALRVINSLQY